MEMSLHKLSYPSSWDRRTELRKPAEGQVVLAPEGNIPELIQARLLDTSASGFRAAHSSNRIETGTRVIFRHSAAAGTARVIWNRIVDGRRESGFLIL